jgi:hypothetical protein
MPIVQFPFLKASPNSIERPMLFLTITNPDSGLSIDTIGIIDTGADCCAIPASYANMLGYNLAKGKPKTVGTGNGTTIAYSHISRIDLYHTERLLKNGDTEKIYTTSEIEIDFMQKLSVVLLGVNNFLSQFFLCVDYPAKLFSVRST